MENMINILYIVLGFLIVLVIVLFLVYIKITMDNNKVNKDKKKETAKPEVQTSKTTKIAKEYSKESIQDFMEFEKVEDSMIIQKNNQRFLMAVEFQGINYDLMSDLEKASIESGFVRFLNTLREPIQIYIQTRTVNLEKNIQSYNTRLSKIQSDMNLKEYKYKQLLEKENIDEKIIKDRKMDFIREKNLYEYGKDVIENTKRMSLNKSILRKKYYIIINYFYNKEGDEVLAPEEIQEMAFSNLYTRALSMIRVLSGIGVTGKVLDSFDLVDLLYNAYNRDESEIFGIEKALNSGFNELYTITQDVLDKKIEALNQKIEQEGLERAKLAIDIVKSRKEQEIEEKEENIEDIIKEIAKEIIKSNENYLGSDITEKSIKEIEKGGDTNEKEQKTKRTRRTSTKS